VCGAELLQILLRQLADQNDNRAGGKGTGMSILGLSITDTRPVTVGAGFWIRALARLIDTAYGSLLGFFAGIVGAITLGILQLLSAVEPGWPARVSHATLMAFVMSLIGNFFYFTICEGVHGATLGKLICQLHVLSEDLTPCRMKSALLRSLAYYLDALVFGAVGYMEMQKTLMEQRHGDRWAKTIVVRNSQVPETARRSTGRFLMALALGSAAWVLTLAAGVVWVGLDAG